MISSNGGREINSALKAMEINHLALGPSERVGYATSFEKFWSRQADWENEEFN